MFKVSSSYSQGTYMRWRAVTTARRDQPILANRVAEDAIGSVEELAREVRTILRRAVERNLIAMYRLALLSGGLDSSTLLALMSKVASAPVDANTPSLPGARRPG
jgi:asparagine synthetase B (glutamine-hydrolysing)